MYLNPPTSAPAGLPDPSYDCKDRQNPGGNGPPFRHISENKRLFFGPQKSAQNPFLMSNKVKKHQKGVLRHTSRYVQWGISGHGGCREVAEGMGTPRVTKSDEISKKNRFFKSCPKTFKVTPNRLFRSFQRDLSPL